MTIFNFHMPFIAAIAVGLLLPSISYAKPKIGQPALDFKAKTFAGDDVKLADYKGQVLIVNIWATWCGPCKRELPLLDAYYALYVKNGLRMIAITTEDSAPNSALKPLQAALHFPLIRNFHGKYGAIDGAVPSNYVIDRAGVLRYAQAGAFDLDTLNKVIVPLLNEHPQLAPTPVAATK